MLTELRIKNFAIIESLTLPLARGFNVLSGETGAGKSIIVGALGLLLGERASADVIRTGAEKATVEGEFNNRIFAVGVAGAVEKAGQVVLPDAWKPGSTLRLKLIGRPASRNPEVPSVKVLSWELPEAQPASPGVEME